MIRGTTAQYRYELPYNFDELESVSITFWQPGNGGPALDRSLPITKTKTNGDVKHVPGNKHIAMVTLTREETLRFVTDRKAKSQLHGTTMSGIDFASNEEYITVYPIADDSITDEPIIPPNVNPIVLDGGSIAEEEVVL